MPSYICISGYSLAGLFSLYAICKSDIFDRAASMSGSLWFPDFVQFFKTNLKRKPSKIYLSLGDKESSARNSYLRTVKDKTIELYDAVVEQGIDCVFESNPGNHFFESDKRCANGIAWILNDNS
jgi:predicted alpha/beta superfamily hydrolase